MLIGCKAYERQTGRKDYRNGYWKRWITLKDGRLEIRMPRIRGMGYESRHTCRYKGIKTGDGSITVTMKTIEDKAFKRIYRKELTESKYLKAVIECFKCPCNRLHLTVE